MGPAHDGATVYSGLGHLAIALAELGRHEAAATHLLRGPKTLAVAAHPAYGWQRVAGQGEDLDGDDCVRGRLGTAANTSTATAPLPSYVAELDAVEAELAKND